VEIVERDAVDRGDRRRGEQLGAARRRLEAEQLGGARFRAALLRLLARLRLPADRRGRLLVAGDAVGRERIGRIALALERDQPVVEQVGDGRPAAIIRSLGA
jgi:hypothetical protein